MRIRFSLSHSLLLELQFQGTDCLHWHKTTLNALEWLKEQKYLGIFHKHDCSALILFIFVFSKQTRGFVATIKPYNGCSEITNPEAVKEKIALMQRGQCMFAEKARNIQKAGAIGGIVIGKYNSKFLICVNVTWFYRFEDTGKLTSFKLRSTAVVLSDDEEMFGVCPVLCRHRLGWAIVSGFAD